MYAISSDHNGALVHAAISAGNSHTTFVGLDAGELFPEVDLFFGLCGEAIIENLDKLSSMKGNRTRAVATSGRVSIARSS